VGTAAPALLIALLAVAPAYADTCTGVTKSGGRFAKCFDLGNRLSLTAGSDGLGGSVHLRHEILFEDEPDLLWKMEHAIVEATYGGWEHSESLDLSLYHGRYLRHARDGKIVLPFGNTRKVFLPFDIGADAQVATVRWRPLESPEDQLRVGVIEIAGLMDFTRSRGYSRRFAIGPVVRWDIDVDRSMGRIGKVSEHTVVPFSTALMDLHFESKDGLYAGGIRGEAGTAWHTKGGWKAEAKAEATLERIVIAINDRPIALTAGVSYATLDHEAIARVGARVVLVHRNDKRVNLNPLKAQPVSTPPPPAPKPAPGPPKIEAPVEPAPVEPAPVEEPPVEEPAPVDEGEQAQVSLPQAWQI